jgi:hypothetical protein
MPIPQNAAHWHIILAHIPALLFMVSAVIMILATLWKDGRWQRVALGFIVAAVVSTGVTFQLGEEAEDIVETLPGTEQYIHPHEETRRNRAQHYPSVRDFDSSRCGGSRASTRCLPAWASWGAVAVIDWHHYPAAGECRRERAGRSIILKSGRDSPAWRVGWKMTTAGIVTEEREGRRLNKSSNNREQS